MSKSKVILLIAFCVYAIGAIFNNSFYYYDEHYQLIEFAELIAGSNKPSDLAWEYEAKIRTAVQPTMAYLFFSLAKVVHVTDAYLLMIALRMLTAILALVIISFFIKKTDFLIKEDLKIWYKLMSYFLWFLPFVNIRFSSESYAGLAFMLSIAVLFSKSNYKNLLVGALMGLSFLFRFQTAFMSLGLMLWMIFIYKTNLVDFLKVLLGGGLILILGFAIDCWFYGQITFTAVNYYISNVVDDVASAYGTAPWYFYFSETINAAILPLGLLILASVVLQLIFNNRGFINWILTPFLFIHLIVPHKELRFLFPVVDLIPLTIVLSLQTLRDFNVFKAKFNWSIVAAAILIIINCTALFINMLSPADDEGRANITQKIHVDYNNKKVLLLTTIGSNPYQPIPLKQHFYLDKNVKQQHLNLFNPIQFDSNVKTLMVARADQINYYNFLFESYNLKELQTGIPDWITRIKTYIGYQNHALLLFEVTPKN